MTSNIKADAAIIIDAAYLDQTGNGLSQFFSNHVLGRELPKADFGHFINAIAFQMGYEPGNHTFFVYFIANEEFDKFSFCEPSFLKEEFHEKAYKDSMGEFIFWVIPTMKMARNSNVVMEISQYVTEEEKLPNIAIVTDLNQCDDYNVQSLIGAAETMSAKIESFSMNPKDEVNFPDFDHQELGHALLNSLGVRPEELS